MNPIEIFLEACADWVIGIFGDHHWTVLLLPVIGAALFFAGLLAGKARFIAVSLLFASTALASDFISFAPSPSVSVTNYTLSYGPTNRSTTNRIQLGTNLTHSVSNLGPASVSFAFVSAWANGIESFPSNEILYTNRNFAPQNLRLSGTDALLLESSPDLRSWKTLAVITNGQAPLMLVKQSRDAFRVLSTNLPPLPK